MTERRVLRIDAEGGLILLSCDADELVLDHVRALPERYFRRRHTDWATPARTENLRTLAQLLADVRELDVDVQLTGAARARLRRLQLATVTIDDGEILLCGPYSEGRLQTLRALPDARFDARSTAWRMPLHRAEAIAVRAIISRGEAVAGPRATGLLARVARGRADTMSAGDGPVTGRSPTAHWRYHLPGNPVFDAGNLPRINDPERGWCVRVRVRPQLSDGEPDSK